MKANIEHNDSDTREQVRSSRTNMIYDILVRIELVVFSRTTRSTEPIDIDALLVRAARTCLMKNNLRLIDYFLQYGCASGYILIKKLLMPRQSVYDALAVLEGYGLIHLITMIPPNKYRSRSAQIWGWYNSTVRQGKDAVSLYERLTQPMYKEAEKMAMDFMEYVVINDGLDTISRGKILNYLVEQNVRPNDRRLFTDIAMKFLHENGYKVLQ